MLLFEGDPAITKTARRGSVDASLFLADVETQVGVEVAVAA
jgi:hypothetical protein